jgi:acetyl esterase/lipase
VTPPGCSAAVPNAKSGIVHLSPADRIGDLVRHPLLAAFADCLLPRDDNQRYYETRFTSVGSLMPYHSHVNPATVVDALNHLIDLAGAGNAVFHQFYTSAQETEDRSKRNTGLIFYKGKPGAPFAIICPGGGFAYVGSLHEGLPLASKISKQGLNAFVIRYRIDETMATEDLAAATAYVLDNAEKLGVEPAGYSLWGASAGARMVGNVVSGNTPIGAAENSRRPAAAVIAYTGQSTWSKQFPPTFIIVSADDPIASVDTVERRVERLRHAGVEVEYHRYRHAGHGFGIGVGTDAEGWVDDAIRFWNAHRGRDFPR